MFREFLLVLFLSTNLFSLDIIGIYHTKLEKDALYSLHNSILQPIKYTLNTSLSEDISDSTISNFKDIVLFKQLNEDDSYFLSVSEKAVENLILENKVVNCANIAQQIQDMNEENTDYRNNIEDICDKYNDKIKTISKFGPYSISYPKDSFIDKNSNLITFEQLNTNANIFNNINTQLKLEQKLIKYFSNTYSADYILQFVNKVTNNNYKSFYSFDSLLKIIKNRSEYLKNNGYDAITLDNAISLIDNDYAMNKYSTNIGISTIDNFDTNDTNDTNTTPVAQIIQGFQDLYFGCDDNAPEFGIALTGSDEICVLNDDGNFVKLQISVINNTEPNIYTIVDIDNVSISTISDDYKFGAVEAKIGNIQNNNGTFTIVKSSIKHNYLATSNSNNNFIDKEKFETLPAAFLATCSAGDTTCMLNLLPTIAKYNLVDDLKN